MISYLKKNQTKEDIYQNGDEYFSKLCYDISQAKKSIFFETYIFKKDKIGDKIIKELISAHRNGVDVKIIVDAIGSPRFFKEYGEKIRIIGIKFVIYRPLPWQNKGTEISENKYSLFEKFSRLHRKVCVIDEHVIFLGSMNVTSDHVSRKNQGREWSDISVRLCSTYHAKQLIESFNLAWKNAIVSEYKYKKSKVRLNHCPETRRFLNTDLLNKLSKASNRVWIATGYMSLNKKCLTALKEAVNRNADVRIILSRDSDVKSSRWISYYNDYIPLLKSNVKIFEYLPYILHAKCCIVDNFFMIGSSNFNGRSRDLDLEADVVLSTLDAKKKLERYFDSIMKNCLQIKSRSDMKKIPIYEILVGTIVSKISIFFASHV